MQLASAVWMLSANGTLQQVSLMDASMSVTGCVIGSVTAKPAVTETHVRSWFPESLYVTENYHG